MSSSRPLSGAVTLMKLRPPGELTCCTEPPVSADSRSLSLIPTQFSGFDGHVDVSRLRAVARDDFELPRHRLGRLGDEHLDGLGLVAVDEVVPRPVRRAGEVVLVCGWNSTSSAVTPTSGARMRVPPSSWRPNWRFVALSRLADWGLMSRRIVGEKRATSRVATTRKMTRQLSRSVLIEPPPRTCTSEGGSRSACRCSSGRR